MDSLKTDKIRLDKQTDVFINKTATKTLTSTSVVEKVMNFHFRDLIRAFKTYNSVEITGFGRFDISQNKLKRQLKEIKRAKEKLEERPEEEIKLRMVSVDKAIAYLEARNQGDETKFQGYIRRMEESFSSTK